MLLGFSLALPVLAAEQRIPGADIARVLDDALTGTQVHLDQDLVEGTKRTPQSFVELPEALGQRRLVFSVPEQRFNLESAGQVEYRVNDVNLSQLRLKATDRDFVLTLYFESDGKEVLARHSGGMVDLGGAVPDLQMNQMKMDVTLTPGTSKDRPVFSEARVTFDAEIHPDGSVASWLASALESIGYQEKMKRLIEREAQKSVGSPAVLQALNARLWQSLQERSGGKVAKARFEGTDLVMEVAPEAPAPVAKPPSAPKKTAKAAAKKAGAKKRK
jgi:hypothetical protein